MASKFLSFLRPATPAQRAAVQAPAAASAPDEKIEQARELHRQGQLDAALALCAEILAAHPDSARAHYQRANILKDQGQLAPALSAYDQAIALQSDYAHAFCNRAAVQWQMGKISEALASYDRAITLDPNDALAQFNRGMLLNGTGQKDAALAGLDKAIACNAQFAPAHFARGALLQERKQWSAALESYDKAIALNPTDVSAICNRGTVLRLLKRWKDALATYERALAVNAAVAQAYAGRAEALQELNRPTEALDSYTEALRINPNDAVTLNARGVVLQKMGQYQAALESYNQALAANPNSELACFNRGTVLADLRDFQGALASYRQAVAIKPDYPEGQLNLALLELKAGEYASGWHRYEWRWHASQRSLIVNEQQRFSQPLWLGETSIAGKTILLHGEQGLGDSLQFCRFCEHVAALGARVILQVPRPLTALFATLRGVAQVVAAADPLPAFDAHCPLMSLPLALKITLDTVPAPARYLHSDPGKVAECAQRLGPKVKPRVGLTWSGSIGAREFSERSFSLARWLPYLPDEFEYFGLQLEVIEADRKTLADSPKVRWPEAELRGFSNTAALCECLDLVISVDTSATHLAAALGKKTWVLTPFDGDWRWLIDREDSPWYPTVRVFRQTTRGDWEAVFKRVAERMRAELAQG